MSTSEDMSVSISMLGRFSLQQGETILTDDINRSLKLWSVLAYLIFHRDRVIPQTELLDLFWPDEEGVNPTSALKTLLYRIRAMLAPLFADGPDPILAQRGGYRWNPALNSRLDVDSFEALAHRAAESDLSPERKKNLCRRAIALYRGDLLPKLNLQSWLVPLAVHYHNLYLDLAKGLAGLLEASEDFAEMHAVAAAASSLDPLDEALQTLVVRALLRQGKDAAALRRYEQATELLYRGLGVRPSSDLRALYQEIMAVEQSLETDLGVITADLKEAAARSGAFFCEYGFFAEAYRLAARRASRSGEVTHLCLITVSLPSGELPPLGILSTTMVEVEAVLRKSLRRGDVVSKFSGAQYVVLLGNANYENSTLVMDRVANSFYALHRHNFLKLTIRIRGLELS